MFFSLSFSAHFVLVVILSLLCLMLFASAAYVLKCYQIRKSTLQSDILYWRAKNVLQRNILLMNYGCEVEILFCLCIKSVVSICLLCFLLLIPCRQLRHFSSFNMHRKLQFSTSTSIKDGLFLVFLCQMEIVRIEGIGMAVL